MKKAKAKSKEESKAAAGAVKLLPERERCARVLRKLLELPLVLDERDPNSGYLYPDFEQMVLEAIYLLAEIDQEMTGA